MTGPEAAKGKTGSPRVPWWGAFGIAVFGFGLWALVGDLEGWNAIWYVPAWYGYLLLLDSVIYALQGHSFVSHRRRELVAMMFWSVPFWFLFEAYNLVLKNWYYVFVLHSTWARVAMTWAAYATVLPACFFHTELVKGLGWFGEKRCRPLRVKGTVQAFCLVVGTLSVAAPLLWPRYAFWMVWGATLWIPDVVNYRIGAPSLLRDLESGRCGRLAQLLLGGLVGGIAWEAFNYWARCKWIYTVPGFEGSKLFEMPFLGFGGFPFLSVAAFAFYSLVCHFLRGGRRWEEPDEQASRPVPQGRHLLGAAVALLFGIAVFYAELKISVRSKRPLLPELNGMDVYTVEKLRGAGIPTPERLYREIRAEGLAAVASQTGIEAERLDRAYRHSALALHKGMGPHRAKLLQAAGIDSVRDLASASSEELSRRLQLLAAREGKPPPRLAEVKVWIRAARLARTGRR